MTVVFVLLLFINNGELIEYTVRDGNRLFKNKKNNRKKYAD